MYQISHFTEADQQQVYEFIKAHPFVTLIGTNDNLPVATQVPVLIEKRNDKLFLQGHIMRKTDHHLAFEQNNNALVLFTGPQCYISASWYSERKTASTWNYMTVHTHGQIKFLDDDQTIGILTALTRQFEDGQSAPELVENMPGEYIQTHIKAIVGFEICVEEIYPVFKLSQNKDDESYKAIVQQLSATNNRQDNDIAKEMIKRRPKLF